MTARPLSLLLVFVVFAVAGCAEVYQDFFTYHHAGNSTGTGTSTGTTGGCVPGEIVACYEGPAGTEGVGLCKPGSKTCAADGATFGSCEGAVVPRLENCATPEDEDCDGKAPACKGQFLWAKRFGDDTNQAAQSVAVDSVGNVIIAGYFGGVVDFGGGPLTSAGGLDLFVAKLDANGAHLWSKSFGDVDDQIAQSVAVDSMGNVVVTGYFGGVVDFGGGPLTSAGGLDLFVAKLDVNGAHLWSRSFGDANDQNGRCVTTNGSGDVLLTGNFLGAVDFGDGPLQSNGGSVAGDIFLAKLRSGDGAEVWSKSFGDAADDVGRSVAMDTAGNIFLAGLANGAANFGGGALSGTGSFLAKLDPSGSHVWSKRFGNALDQVPWGIAADSSGGVLVTGYFTDTVDFGGGPVQSAGGEDAFLTELTGDGAYKSSKRFGDASDQSGKGVAVDASGNVVVVGFFDGQADFGGGPVQSAGGQDIFLFKLDASGVHQWSHRFGDSGGQFGTAVAVDAQKNAIITGYFNGSIDFGGGSLISAGASDIFVAKFGE
jgi:hypothetical protein